ncbi:MAG: endonuclease III [Bacteroidales bacterium]|nr:endonuclease III [Bacteroidales bacterium]
MKSESKDKSRFEPRFEPILDWFEANRPLPKSELVFMSPYQLIVAVILSAQCTDKRVNLTTPAFYERFPDIASLAAASPEEVFPLIRSISYPNSKAAHLVAMARKVTDDFGGEIPRDIDSLMTLPGVGRKTANVVTSVLYDEPVIAVDTHVFRVARRLGLSDGKTPYAVELDLESGIPESVRPKAHHWLILHGRYVCTARNPKCGECGLSPYCRHHAQSR